MKDLDVVKVQWNLLFRLLLLLQKPLLMEMTPRPQLPPALHQLQIIEKNITDTFFATTNLLKSTNIKSL